MTGRICGRSRCRRHPSGKSPPHPRYPPSPQRGTEPSPTWPRRSASRPAWLRAASRLRASRWPAGSRLREATSHHLHLRARRRTTLRRCLGRLRGAGGLGGDGGEGEDGVSRSRRRSVRGRGYRSRWRAGGRWSLLVLSCGDGDVAVVGVVLGAGGVGAACEVGIAPAEMSGCGGFLDAATVLILFHLLCGVARPNASTACTRQDGGVSHFWEELEKLDLA